MSTGSAARHGWCIISFQVQVRREHHQNQVSAGVPRVSFATLTATLAVFDKYVIELSSLRFIVASRSTEGHP